MRYRALILVLLSLFLLAGCGFHLRGQWVIAPQYQCMRVLTPNRYSNFTRQLRQTLAHNQVRLIDHPDKSCALLTFSKVEFKHDAPTIGTINTARVFRFYIDIHYQINGGPTQEIITSRFSTLNAGILTTTNNQVHLVEMGLIEDAIRQLLNRLSCPHPSTRVLLKRF